MIVDSNRSPGGYRPKGRPQDQELEDESGSEAEFGIQVSKSLAQEKLKALVEGGIAAHGNRDYQWWWYRYQPEKTARRRERCTAPGQGFTGSTTYSDPFL